MIRSIGDQNKHLSDAAKTPKDTSPRLANANKYSAKIVSSVSAEHRPDSDIGGQNIRHTGNKIKGSLEGLHNGSSTVLQFSNYGYDAKAAQKSRFKEKSSLKELSLKSNSFTLNKNYSIMNNYSSLTIEKSSSDRLTNIIRNNMMLR